MMNANMIDNCNTEKLEEQKQELIDKIVYGQNEGYFLVFDIEAGCRKTRTAEDALYRLWKKGGKAIFVRLFDVDCRESRDIINGLAGEEIAFAYNNEDVTPVMARNLDLDKYPILIITHQKYRVLMIDSNKRKRFANGRSTLVVDEFLSSIQVISLSESDIRTYKELFREDVILLMAFNNAIQKLEDALIAWNSNGMERRFATITHPDSETQAFNDLLKYLKANTNQEWLKKRKTQIIADIDNKPHINYELLTEISSKKILCDKLLGYKQLYANVCLYCDKKLLTTDKNYKYWFLENNIMLDASGELQIAYELNKDIFKLKRCEKVLNHRMWNIMNIPITTTLSGKEKLLNFYDVVNDDIKKYGDDILVVGKKDEMDKIDLPEENKGHFGNLTGRNSWYDKKNIAIIHTHNLSDTDYILKFMHYSREKLDETYNLKAKRKKIERGSRLLYSFDDPRLENVRVYWIASELYQAIKRINRNMKYDSNVLIYLNNDKVIDLIQEQMKECVLTIHEDMLEKFLVQKSKQDEYVEALKKNAYAAKFIQFLAEVKEGMHQEFIDNKRRIQKVKVRQYLGIKTSANFSNKVLNNSDVVLYCRTRNITLNGHYIELPQ